jgi:hypothetical protein
MSWLKFTVPMQVMSDKPYPERRHNLRYNRFRYRSLCEGDP